MAIVNRISEQAYRERALRDAERLWELWDGVPVEKPLLSMKHDDVAFHLGYLLQSQLDRNVYRINVNGGKTRHTPRNYFIPDVVVIPAVVVLPFANDPQAFNAFAEPLPLVVDVWSPATGAYDVETKVQGYRKRGDAEI
jgi:Uma2 family endonuclease